MRLFLSLMIVLTMLSSTTMAQTSPSSLSPEKKALILKFLDVSGTRSSLNENLDMMIKQVPPEQAQEAAKMREEIKVDDIIDQLVPVYDRNFTTEELQGLISFYDSPLGQKFLQKLPEVMKESVEISSKYMESKLGPNTLPASEAATKP